MGQELELCTHCDCATGRAGAGDDSLYAVDGTGPYCEECWDDEVALTDAMARATEQDRRLDAAKAEVRERDERIDKLSEALGDMTGCTCGCPADDHEAVDGWPCCEHGHECYPVWPAVAALFDETRERLRLADEMVGPLRDMTDAEGCESGGSPDCGCGVCLSLSSLNAYRNARGAK